MVNDSIPTSKAHFAFFQSMIRQQLPFVFVRFSDGELEIIRNRRLEINETQVIWRNGIKLDHTYPVHDVKVFDPRFHQHFRRALIAAAEHRGENYFKGIPARHNDAVEDRDYMIKLNAGDLNRLTFADLFLNENYRKFLHKVVPLFSEYRHVSVLGNFRMQPHLHNQNWKLISIPDNFIANYMDVFEDVISRLQSLPEKSLVLLSASSLSNTIGMRLSLVRRDLTCIDIGTTMHGMMGLGGSSRAYHVHAERLSGSNAIRKLRFRLKGDYRLRW